MIKGIAAHSSLVTL